MEKSPIVAAAYLARGAFLASMVLVVAPSPSRGGGFSEVDAMVWSRLGLFAALVASSVAVVVLSRRQATGLKASTVLGAAAFQFAAGFGYPLVSAGVLPQGFLSVDLAVQGLVLPVLNAAWAGAYATLDDRRCTAMTAGSLGVAGLLVGLHHLAPLGLAWLVSATFPLSALALLWLLRRQSAANWRKPPAQAKALRPSQRFVVGTLCAFAAANVMAGSAEAGGFIAFSSVLTSVLAAGLVLGALAVRPQPPNLLKVNVAVLLVLVVAYTGSGLLIGTGGGLQDALRTFQHCSVMALEQCMAALTWLIALQSTRRTRVNPVFTVGLAFAAVFAGRGVGALVGILTPLDPAALSILALFLFVPAVLCLGTDVFTVNAPEAARGDEPSLDLQSFGAAYGLTPREQEVLELWALGGQLDSVAEQLGVSKNTAKTHVAHIYRKVGVSTREELLGLVRRP